MNPPEFNKVEETKKPRVLVLTGDGINCEMETAAAFELAGFHSEILHINECIDRKITTQDLTASYKVLALPGGFSFGDDLSSGKVLALKIKFALKWNLTQFAQHGGLVIGICNGFQALIRLGIFGTNVSITQNISGRFMDRWVKVIPQSNHSPWLKGIGMMDLPIRHGEGRLVFGVLQKKEILEKLNRNQMLCLKYQLNPNGSEESLAGLCDPTGRILGLMPHPEAFTQWTMHPEWTGQPDRAGAPGDGLKIFLNAFEEVT